MSRAALRASAREWRAAELGLPADRLVSAEQIVRLSAQVCGYSLFSLPAGDPLLSGAFGVLDREAGSVWLDGSLPKARRMAVAAHEFAHHVLHSDCVPGDFAEPQSLDSDAQSESESEPVAGYSPRRRREVDANVWALELLLPTPAVRSAFFERGMGAAQIADAAEVSVEMARVQMRACLLRMPADHTTEAFGPHEAEEKSVGEPSLDESQRSAAEVASGPFLLTAGPGAGKTRTLVARCAHLVHERGVPAERILALTFSRRSAGEMRDRLIACGIGGAASGPWVGTFHALCMDLLRRYPEQSGLPSNWSLIGETEAYNLLERQLPRLKLREIADIAAPTAHLRDILHAVSRAQDELCSAEQYAVLARSHIADCAGGSRSDEAIRLAETARVYAAYDAIKRQLGRLDFGDLIGNAVALLEQHEEVALSLRRQFPHIVADEYQDVNHASARLLKLLAGPSAAGLWVVGDRRQSIYRFRGASPANVAQFERDFPGGRRGELRVNYRSQPPIVRVFESAAERLSAAEPGRFTGWQCARGTEVGAGVRLFDAPDAASQATGMAAQMQALRAEGMRYCDQAVLCRTHGEATRLAGQLSDAGIPVLYVGDLLNRPVVKDLLCLLDAFAERSSTGEALLPRLGRMAGGLTAPDELRRWAKLDRPGASLADRLLKDPQISDDEPLLTQMLAASGPDRSPAALLIGFLFDRPAYLRSVVDRSRSVLTAAVDLLAVRSLLNLAAERTASYSREFAQVQDSDVDAAIDPVSWFLRQLRRAAQSGERISAAADEDDEVDAVRLMTIHASKGLEFPAVFLPNLSDGRFPLRDRAPYIAEPRGMVAGLPMGDTDQEEEACLFFVALSRARDHLFLSHAHAQEAGGRVEKPSPFLSLIETGLKRIGVAAKHWKAACETVAAAVDAGAPSPVPNPKPRFAASDLEMYRRCPKRYQYRVVLGFAGAADRGPYGLYRECIEAAALWMQQEWRERGVPDEAEVRARAEEMWQDEGAPDDLYRAMYRERAMEVVLQVRGMYAARAAVQTPSSDRALAVEMENCVVHIAADLVAMDREGSVHIVRHRDGRPRSGDGADPRLSLLRAGAEASFRGRSAVVEIGYARTGEVRAAAPSARFEPGRIRQYEQSAAGIIRGRFDPAPDVRQCPSCPFFFICPE